MSGRSISSIEHPMTVDDLRRLLVGLPGDTPLLSAVDTDRETVTAGVTRIDVSANKAGGTEVQMHIRIEETNCGEAGQTGACALCGGPEDNSGEGWDDLCDSCADRVSDWMDKRGDENLDDEHNRDEAIRVLTAEDEETRDREAAAVDRVGSPGPVTDLRLADIQTHEDWDEDGIEDGEELWRLDALPPMGQIQLFARIRHTVGEFRLFVEREKRDDAGNRIFYAGAFFPIARERALALLQLKREAAEMFLEEEILAVLKLPDDPSKH